MPKQTETLSPEQANARFQKLEKENSMLKRKVNRLLAKLKKAEENLQINRF